MRVFLVRLYTFRFYLDAVKRNVFGLKSAPGSFMKLITFTLIPQYIYRHYNVFLRYIESLYFYLVPPNILDEESSPSSVTIRENHNASLQCNAEGTPQPRITWRREDGKKIIIKKKKNAGKKG